MEPKLRKPQPIRPLLTGLEEILKDTEQKLNVLYCSKDDSLHLLLRITSYEHAAFLEETKQKIIATNLFNVQNASGFCYGIPIVEIRPL